MTLWVIAAVLTASAVVAVIWPLMRVSVRPDVADTSEQADVSVYRDQLAEVDRDAARGLISADQADAARVEISRRMIAAADRVSPATAPSAAGTKWLAGTLVVLIPLAALALYLPFGAPDLPSRPFADRDPAEREAIMAITAEIDTIERQLAATPHDIAGWVALARRYSAVDRHSEAATAYARALGLSDGDSILTGAYAEALVSAANGVVTEQARAAFRQVVEAAPDDPRARFYLALAHYQSGDTQAALTGWQALAGDSPADAPWLPTLEGYIMEAAERLDLDPGTAVPSPLAAEAPGTEPTEADIAAAADMTPEQRADMVRGMVDSLAARLEQEPDDLEGWLRLGHAYRVIGEPQQATAAYQRASALAPDDPVVLRTLADAWIGMLQDDALPTDFVALLQRLQSIDPEDPRALWFLGVEAVDRGDPAEARRLWSRLRDTLPEGSAERSVVERRLDDLAPTDGTAPPPPG